MHTESRRGALVALALVVASLSSRGAGAQELPPPPTRDTVARNVGVLRSGDALKIVVYRDKELSGEYLIDSRGQVQIPGLGVINAAGLDPTQVKDTLRSALLKRGFTDPEIAVQPLIRVSVLGEVRQPALYPVDPGMSLIQLVTIAGGPTSAANLRRTRVVREGRVFEVDLQSALAGSASGRVVLYSNDVVVVPKRTGFTRENLTFILGLTSTAVTIATFIVASRPNK
jgi:polysaccharide export outer membrane protein